MHSNRELSDTLAEIAKTNQQVVEDFESAIESYKNVINTYNTVFKKIALLGGNLSDDVLISRTGPNDAVARGLMYIQARIYALSMLNKTINDLMKEDQS